MGIKQAQQFGEGFILAVVRVAEAINASVLVAQDAGQFVVLGSGVGEVVRLVD